MAFPSTSVLDAFTRSDEAPIASGWAGPTRPSRGLLKVISNQLAQYTVVGSTAHAYKTASYAADQEVWATVATLPASSGGISVLGRIQNPNTATLSAYQFSYHVGTGWRCFVISDDGYDQLGSTIASPAMSAGDKIGMEIIGTTIRGLHYTGGVWNQIMSNTDSVVSGAGSLGIEMTDTTARMDDFGGGAYTAVTLDDVLPDADVVTTGWTTAPLYSKINDSSDATIMQATAV